MSAEAPAAGVEVTLSAGDSSVVVPDKVTVAAGSLTGTFTFTSSRVPSARDVTVMATAGGASQTATVRIRALDSEGSLSFTSRGPTDDVGQGQTLTFRAPLNRFVGEVRGDNRTVDIRIAVGGDFVWGLMLSAPPSESLRVKRYENATPSSERTAQVNFYHAQRRCGDSGFGEFEVLEAEFGPSGIIYRFRARFTQRCSAFDPFLTGEVSVQNPPRN